MNGPFEYVERRLEPQRKWHNEKATWNKRRFYTVEVATLLAGAAIPIVNLWLVEDPYWAGVLCHSWRSRRRGGIRREALQVS